MEKFKVIGIENVKYFSRKSNRDVRGTRFYLQYVDEKEGVVGIRCTDVFFSDRIILPSIDLNDIVYVFYNEYGSPCSLSVIE